MSKETRKGISNAVLQIIVVVLGIFVFAVVFFSDKTNLNNKDSLSVSDAGVATRVNNSVELEKDPEIQTWVDSLALRKGEEKLPYLDSIVVNLRTRRKFALASDYAVQRIEIDSSLESLLMVADLSKQALQMESVRKDTARYRLQASRRLALLQGISAQDPDNEEYLMDLGMALVDAGGQNSMNGILTIRKILELNPDNVAASYQLGLFSLQTGQFDRAAQRFEKVLSLENDNDNARYQLAYANAQIGQKEKAKSLLDEIVARNADPQLVNLAKALIRSL